MAENDRSCGMVAWKKGFFAQSSALITYLLTLITEYASET